MSNDKKLSCVCGKFYSSAPSLCVHRKKCNIFLEHKSCNQGIVVNETYTMRINELENIIKSKDEEIQSLKNEIQTFKNSTQNIDIEINPILEVENFNIKKSKIKVKSLSSVQRNDNLLYIHTTDNSNTNHIKTANVIPKFSNTALNFTQFLDEINIELSHFESVAVKGCVTCFMQVIEDQLQMVEPDERPFHYDKQNKILYIKNKDNEWVIDKNNGLLRVFVLRLSKKYMNLVDEYKEKYINVDNADHKENSNYSLIIQELNSLSDDEPGTLKQIMKSVRRCIPLNK